MFLKWENSKAKTRGKFFYSTKMFLKLLNSKFLAFLCGALLFVGYSANALQCYSSQTTPPQLVDCKPEEDACVVLQQDSDSKIVTLECRHQDPSVPDCDVVELPTQHGKVRQRWHYCYCKGEGCNTATVCYCGGMPPGDYRTTQDNSTSVAEGIHSKSKSTTVGMITGLIFMIIIYKLFQDLSQPTPKGTL